MLNGIIKGDLELNKNVNKYLDMCLKCNACHEFCPSGIDARKIFLAAKSDYFKLDPYSKLISFFQSKIVFNSFLKLIKTATTLYRLFKIDKIAKKFYPPFINLGWVGKKIIFANEFVSKEAETVLKSDTAEKKSLKIVYFKGCVNEFINPKVKNATEKILNKLGAEILSLDFECCGVPFLSSGNVEQFVKQAEFNLSQIPEEFDYFLTDCASCQSAFVEYKNYIADSILLEKLDKIIEKSMNVSDFIEKNIDCIEFSTPQKVTFHKPCHLESMDFFYKIMAKTKNVQYVEMEDFDKCCGFSGEFAIKNQKLSAEISKKKVKNALGTGAETILTSCPACVLGLLQGAVENFKESKRMPKIYNIVEFIASADCLQVSKNADYLNMKDSTKLSSVEN